MIHRRQRPGGAGAALLLLAACVSPAAGQDSATVVLAVNLGAETATVTNHGLDPLTLTGWTIESVEGGQTFTFPDGFTVQPGDSVTVTSGPNARDEPPAFFRWTGRHVWSNEGDPGRLLNWAGEVVATTGGDPVAEATAVRFLTPEEIPPDALRAG